MPEGTFETHSHPAEHIGNTTARDRAKASLRELPLVPGGVGEVRVWTLQSVIDAAAEFVRANNITARRQRMQVESAVVWITYRCSGMSMASIGAQMGRASASVHRFVQMFDKEIHLGKRRPFADGILRILVKRGHATPAAVRVVPKTAIESAESARDPQPCEFDPDIELIRKWRDRGFSVKRIAKYTEISEEKVARVLNIQWGQQQ